MTIEANALECVALAARFRLVVIDALSATISLKMDGASIIATGAMSAKVIQSCVASAADVSATILENVTIRFVSALAPDDAPDEVELEEADCDFVEHDGQAIDLGEAIAQSLSLALNPFPRARGAEEILKHAGVLSEAEVQTGAFAGLKGLIGNG